MSADHEHGPAASAINRHVPTRAGELAVADQGSGTPVVLWPSLFSDHRLYDHVVPLLGDRWRTIRVDGPGFGRSEAPTTDVQTERYAGAVVDILDALEIDQAVVAGCSWGGQVCAHAGVEAPERVSGVLMMNTPMATSQGGAGFQVIGTRWFGSTRFWGNGVARSMLAKSTRDAHPERVEAFVSAFPSFDRKAASVTVRTVMTQFPGLADVLPDLSVPTVILMGEQDALYPPESAMPIARLAPTARIEVVPDCGHLAPIEAPEAVAAALASLAPEPGRELA